MEVNEEKNPYAWVVCNECKEKILVGWSCGVFYSEYKERMELLGKFLFTHKNHKIKFTEKEPKNYREWRLTYEIKIGE